MRSAYQDRKRRIDRHAKGHYRATGRPARHVAKYDFTPQQQIQHPVHAPRHAFLKGYDRKANSSPPGQAPRNAGHEYGRQHHAQRRMGRYKEGTQRQPVVKEVPATCPRQTVRSPAQRSASAANGFPSCSARAAVGKQGNVRSFRSPMIQMAGCYRRPAGAGPRCRVQLTPGSRALSSPPIFILE